MPEHGSSYKDTALVILEELKRADPETYRHVCVLIIDIAALHYRLDEAGRQRLRTGLRRVLADVDGQTGR